MTPSNTDKALEVLTLDLQGEIFALEAGQVREILDYVHVTEVPGSQPFVNGLINVRGKVVPLADLRIKFGMELKDATVDTRIVVIEIDIDGVPSIIGIRADKVHEVTELLPSALEETPKLGMKWRPEFIRCIGKRGSDFIVVPNIERIFSRDAGDVAVVVADTTVDRNAAPALPARG
jgi:purine-binding chemotaxis protein CheW